MKKRIGLIAISLLIFSLLLSTTVFAQEKNYTINNGEIIAIPEVYDYSYSINTVTHNSGEITHFNQPTDLFLDSQGYLYIADTKNNRVVKMTTDGTFVQEITEFNGVAFNEPQGVFVSDTGDVYISDTGNSRIVQFNAKGETVSSYGMPESPMLSDVQTYSPTKIGMSATGAVYVLMGENIMLLDSQNTFRGFIGQSDIGFDFTDWLLRIVASEEQKKSIEKRNADPYTNFCLDSRGMIYAVSRDTQEGQIKVLNTVGNNIYKKVGTLANDWQAIKQLVSSFFSGNIQSKSFTYGEITEEGLPAVFADICVDKNGIVTVIEANTCKIYQYDAQGNLLAVFGGKGSNQGEFYLPSSMVVDNEGRLYILDQSYGNITVLEPSKFITTVQEATVAYNEGKYDEADALWKAVLDIDETYPMTHFGAGLTAMKAGDWKSAMEHFKYSEDRAEYSKAFAEMRYEIIKQNFWLIALIVVAFAVALVVLLRVVMRSSKTVLVDFELGRKHTLGFKDSLLFGMNILNHPVRTLEAIKYNRGRISVAVPAVLFVVAFAVRLFFIFTVHYPMQDIDPDEMNLFLEFIKLLLPVLTWIGAVFLISAQFDGESTLKQNFIAGGFTLIPYILVTLLADLLSQIMCWNETGFYAVLVNGVTLWMVWLLYKAVRHLNDYTIGHTLVVCLVTLVAVVLIWFVCLFAYSLIVCLVQLVQDIIVEAQFVI
ncbi:MAG: YIP1 family protein [Clostridia bacterium]|nr:YIP1 family protein [Clostridia bacterium]